MRFMIVGKINYRYRQKLMMSTNAAEYCFINFTLSTINIETLENFYLYIYFSYMALLIERPIPYLGRRGCSHRKNQQKTKKYLFWKFEHLPKSNRSNRVWTFTMWLYSSPTCWTTPWWPWETTTLTMAPQGFSLLSTRCQKTFTCTFLFSLTLLN